MTLEVFLAKIKWMYQIEQICVAAINLSKEHESMGVYMRLNCTFGWLQLPTPDLSKICLCVILHQTISLMNLDVLSH